MSLSTAAAHVLLIADDSKAGEIYRRVLEFVGYRVTQTSNFLDVLGPTSSDADLIVLCNLTAVPYPGQAARIIRIPEGAPPDTVVTEVYRRMAPQPELAGVAG